ncbi:MAG: acyl-CoA thioesterase [Alistipes sp.]|jgi:acyl-CoA thioester hydrolase|nr:acyl-CoA thioesterase [Alistipes sp.]
MKKVIETGIQKRFADIDMFRHVNNIHQQAYLDLGKTDYYRRVLALDALIHNPTLVIVSASTEFIGQVRYEDEITVRSWVERAGGKSITLRQQIVCSDRGGGAVKTESESVLVCFDLHTQQTRELPDAWRAAIDG